MVNRLNKTLTYIAGTAIAVATMTGCIADRDRITPYTPKTSPTTQPTTNPSTQPASGDMFRGLKYGDHSDYMDHMFKEGLGLPSK